MMPVKIQCGCGQRYAFDIEPYCGRMPASVTCPVCGADGTSAANEVIALNLSTESASPRDGLEGMVLLAVVGCLIAGIVGVIKASTMASGLDVLLCLWGAVLAFGVATGVYFWRQAESLSGLESRNTRAARHASENRKFRVPV